MKEVWKDVVGYEGRYLVSNLGRVKSPERDKVYPAGFVCHAKEKFICVTFDRDGYPRVSLWKDRHLKTFQVHRLVAEAFIPNPSSLPQVNHKDEIKYHNFPSNLEWCTNKYNNNYGTKIDRQKATRQLHAHKAHA